MLGQSVPGKQPAVLKRIVTKCLPRKVCTSTLSDEEFTRTVNCELEIKFTFARCLYAGRPDPPYDVHLTSCGTLKAVVEWSPGSDNNDPIVQYIVYYNTSFDEPDRFTEGARATARHQSAAIRLQPWTNYTFSIQARNSLGLSERSAFTPAICTTPQQKPYKNPSDVCSVSRGADQLVVTWQVCTSYRDSHIVNAHTLVYSSNHI